MSPRQSHPTESSIPEHCWTHTLHRVSVMETDMMGIVHHANYVALLERGRLEYLRHRGLAYKALVQSGFHMPVVELNIRYRKPARFEDVLRIETRLGAVSRVTVRFDYVVSRLQPESSMAELLIEANVLLACVDEKTNVLLACVDEQTRPRALPQAMRHGLFLPEQPRARLTPGNPADPAGSV
jgi:acyl-CoA thioester hydrolase